jgi:hypothetical protein
MSTNEPALDECEQAIRTKCAAQNVAVTKGQGPDYEKPIVKQLH